MILTAGPGVGKSVFAAKVCQLVYKDKGKLAACHFCKFNFADYKDPHKMLQSLAVHMCTNVNKFQKTLVVELQRNNTRDSVTDAFRVLLKDPLNSLENQEPMLIVIDALDESETGGKSELLDLIAEEFPKLPTWIKVFITSRPELPVLKKLTHFNPIEIRPDNADNKKDLKSYLQCCLKDLDVSIQTSFLKIWVDKCEGSFLYAYHCQLELCRLKGDERLRADDISVDIMPQSIGVCYEKYFERLEKELKKLSSEIDFSRILEVLVVMKGPLPLNFVAEILNLPSGTCDMNEVICKVNDSLSALLLVYDNCLTVFHKTVVDWLLLSSGYNWHRFVVTRARDLVGHKHLWQACRERFVELERKATDDVTKTAEQKYAIKHGIGHLKKVTHDTGVPSSNRESAKGFSTWRSSIAVVKFEEANKNRIHSGFGWILFQDGKVAYLMTTREILNHILQHQSSKLQAGSSVSIAFLQGKPVSVPIEHVANRVVVSSDEDSVLDYAVLKLKCNVGLGAPFKVSERLAIDDVVYTPTNVILSSATKSPPGIVSKYPEELVSWLKFSTSSEEIPALKCYRNVDWQKVEEQKEALIHHPIERSRFRMSGVTDSYGLPLVNKDDEVVGMSSLCVYLDDKNTEPEFTCFSVRMDKIIEDIRSKKPDLAKKLFPKLLQC